MKLKIVRDEDPMCPREWENFGTMACWHNKYKLGDEQPQLEPKDFIDDLPEGTVILPLYLYDHSGITMNTTGFTSPWDSGQVGIIYCTPKTLSKKHGTNLPLRNGKLDSAVEEQTIQIMKDEVEVYDQFLRGDVWGFQLIKECPECGHDTEVEDSCFGFFGDNMEAIKDYLDEQYWPQLEEAWENRE
jgi:hypothetical protein